MGRREYVLIYIGINIGCCLGDNELICVRVRVYNIGSSTKQSNVNEIE